MATQPNLGYGKPTEATIDQVNQWMRSSPWYQELLTSFGQDPNNVHLSKGQRDQVIKAAQAQGVVVDQGDMEVDPSGNFNPKGHKLRNTLIVAGLAATGIGAYYAAPAIAGMLGGSGGAVGGGGAAATGASAAGAGVTTAGIGTGGLVGGLGTAAGGLIPAAGGIAAPLASTAIGTGAIGGIAGGTGLAGTVGGGGALSGLGRTLASRLGSSEGLEATGKALAGNSQAQASNRGTMAELMLDQNDQLERQLIAREEEKRKAQNQAYSNAQIGDRAATWQPLQRPAEVGGSYQGPSDASRAAGSDLYSQAMKRFQMDDLKNPTGMPTYNNLNNNQQFQDQLKPGVGERVSGHASWLLPLAGALLNRR